MLLLVLNTELCPAMWAKPRREIVLKVCISLHSSAYPRHYRCTTAGSLQAKGLCDKSKRKEGACKQINEPSEKLGKCHKNETHRCWPPFCRKSLCMWITLPVEAELLPSRDTLWMRRPVGSVTCGLCEAEGGSCSHAPGNLSSPGSGCCESVPAPRTFN